MIKLNHKSLDIKKLFRKSLEAFPDLIFLVSHDGTYLDYLGNEKNLFVPPEEFIGKKIIDVMPRNIAKLHIDAIRKTIETKQMQTLEISLPIRDETRYFEDRFIYFSKEHIVIFVRDITKRKQVEQKLRKSEEKLKKFNKKLEQMINERTREIIESEKKYKNERNNLINILNSMEDGVYIVNQQFEIEFLNQKLIKEFGPKEGKKCYDYFHDRQEICPWCKNQDVFGGKSIRWEWKSFKNQKIYDLIDTPLKNPNGSISKLEIFRDITDRKQLEQNLKESEISLRKSKLELEIKNQISNVFLTVPDDKMYGEVLSIILKPLKSEFGIFGYLDENENLVEPSLTEDGWEKCMIEDKRVVFSKKLWAKNIYGRVINGKNALYVNKFFNVPKGHIPISNFLGSPIIYKNKVIGIFIVSNKESDYEEHDVKILESISDLIAPILAVRLERDRIENIRQRVEQDLKESEEKYRESYNRVIFYQNLIAHDVNNILNNVKAPAEMISHLQGMNQDNENLNDLINIIKNQASKGAILVKTVRKLS
ncbi:hypothetical protein LCGC14_2071940, partial [marine sediment metagenome]